MEERSGLVFSLNQKARLAGTQFPTGFSGYFSKPSGVFRYEVNLTWNPENASSLMPAS